MIRLHDLDVSEGRSPENLHKNRNQDILPPSKPKGEFITFQDGDLHELIISMNISFTIPIFLYIKFLTAIELSYSFIASSLLDSLP